MECGPDGMVTEEVADRALAQKIANFLNGALELDPVAVSKLIETRVPSNDAFAAHPTIQVVGHMGREVGLLGLLNGLIGIDDRGYGILRAVYEDTERVVRFDLASDLHSVKPPAG